MDAKPATSLDGAMATKNVPKVAMTAKQAKDASEEEGTVLSIGPLTVAVDIIKEPKDAMTTNEAGEVDITDIPKNATTAKVASEECAPSLPSLGRPKKTGLHLFFMNIRHVLKLDALGTEIARIAIPAALALAADPLASLVDTAFIGRIGSVELAAVGVSIAIFNQVSKVAIYPLVSVTTSFVAEEDAICSKTIEEKGDEDLEKEPPVNNEMENFALCTDPKGTESKSSYFTSTRTKVSKFGRKRSYIPSVSSALVVGAILGFLQAILLTFGAKVALHIMGVKSNSPMLAPAHRYLQLRALGAPAVLLSLAMQGVFRGFKDTKTPLYASVAGDATNIILDPILIFACHMGVSGAAIAHVLSQYLITLILLFNLVKQVDVVPPSIKALKISRFLKCGFLLLARVISATVCVTLAASLAAHSGPISMAAFQICLQLWLATSLLADGLAVAGQAILATAFAKGDYHKVATATSRVLQLSIVLGAILTVFLGVGMKFGTQIFTKDAEVVKIVHKCIPFVAATQPINSLAFVFDGVNFGASDYTFSAYSMVAVAFLSIPCLIFLSKSYGLIGIWIALTIYMSLRTFFSTWRMGAATGPWVFLRK